MKLTIISPRPLADMRVAVEKLFSPIPRAVGKEFVSPSNIYPDRETDCGRFIQIRPISESHKLRVFWGLPERAAGTLVLFLFCFCVFFFFFFF